jgi:hypothetical protein
MRHVRSRVRLCTGKTVIFQSFRVPVAEPSIEVKKGGHG